MPTGSHHVCLPGKTGSDRPTVKTALLTRTEQSKPPHNIPVACLHAQARSYDAEKVQRQEKYLGIVKSLPQCEFAHCLGGAAFSGDRGDEPAALFRGEEFAWSGRSVRTKNVITPIPTVGIASAMYMTCQPRRPNRPSRPRSPVDIGAPTATLARAKNALAHCAFTGVARSATPFLVSTLVP
jgi:hypothetical protein